MARQPGTAAMAVTIHSRHTQSQQQRTWMNSAAASASPSGSSPHQPSSGSSCSSSPSGRSSCSRKKHHKRHGYLGGLDNGRVWGRRAARHPAGAAPARSQCSAVGGCYDRVCVCLGSACCQGWGALGCIAAHCPAATAPVVALAAGNMLLPGPADAPTKALVFAPPAKPSQAAPSSTRRTAWARWPAAASPPTQGRRRGWRGRPAGG